MQMKRSSLLIFFVVLFLVGLTACERSLAPKATPKPSTSANVSNVTPTLAPTSELMGQILQFATQTAMASKGTTVQNTPVAPVSGTPEAEVSATSEAPAAVEETSQPEPTAAPTEVPTLAPARVVPTATPGHPESYTLQKGEHIFCVARRFNVNPSELLSLNGLGANTLVYAGMTLKIPPDSSFPGTRSLRSHPTTYTVSSGETLSSIACLFGDVDPNSVAYANNLSVNAKLDAGQKLYIP
jgi:LysM repeat protein